MSEVPNKVLSKPEVYHSSLDNSTIAKIDIDGGANRNYFRYTDEKHINAGAKALL